MTILYLLGIIIVVNILVAVYNLIFPFMHDKGDENKFETWVLLFVGSFIVSGMVLGWFLRLFYTEKENTVILPNNQYKDNV